MTIEFEAWPKIARLNRDIVITEKIDGTNAAVGFLDDGMVYAQSRTRIITPEQDNFGFARWAYDNADGLFAALGPGLHFGEWWGSGIQRGYGLTKGEKRFSLFNTARWGRFNNTADLDCFIAVPGLDVVPVLYEGAFSSWYIDHELDQLDERGSLAAPGFMKPEGICIYHTHARTMFKVTIENDEIPKGMAA